MKGFRERGWVEVLGKRAGWREMGERGRGGGSWGGRRG